MINLFSSFAPPDLSALSISFQTMASKHYCKTDISGDFLLMSWTEITYVNLTSLMSLSALSNSAFLLFVKLQV